MQPQPVDIQIRQGRTFTLSLLYEDSEGAAVDLTGYTALAQVRHTVAAPDPMLTLKTQDGSIKLGADGAIDLEASAESTATVAQAGVWELVIFDPSGKDTTLVTGQVAVIPPVAR